MSTEWEGPELELNIFFTKSNIEIVYIMEMQVCRPTMESPTDWRDKRTREDESSSSTP